MCLPIFCTGSHWNTEAILLAAKNISEKYGEIITERIQDDKPISGTEQICDKFCVIEKDIDYGICITSHKSQGSSFKTVFIDESDFDKLQDSWSYDLDCKINAIKEKNQLKYVAFTRPSNFAHILKRDALLEVYRAPEGLRT